MRGSRKYATKLHEVVNNTTSAMIDPFGELFIHWIPAFARKTVVLNALLNVLDLFTRDMLITIKKLDTRIIGV